MGRFDGIKSFFTGSGEKGDVPQSKEATATPREESRDVLFARLGLRKVDNEETGGDEWRDDTGALLVRHNRRKGSDDDTLLLLAPLSSTLRRSLEKGKHGFSIDVDHVEFPKEAKHEFATIFPRVRADVATWYPEVAARLSEASFVPGKLPRTFLHADASFLTLRIASPERVELIARLNRLRPLEPKEHAILGEHCPGCDIQVHDDVVSIVFTMRDIRNDITTAIGTYERLKTYFKPERRKKG